MQWGPGVEKWLFRKTRLWWSGMTSSRLITHLVSLNLPDGQLDPALSSLAGHSLLCGADNTKGCVQGVEQSHLPVVVNGASATQHILEPGPAYRILRHQQLCLGRGGCSGTGFIADTLYLHRPLSFSARLLAAGILNWRISSLRRSMNDAAKDKNNNNFTRWNFMLST